VGAAEQYDKLAYECDLEGYLSLASTFRNVARTYRDMIENLD